MRSLKKTGGLGIALILAASVSLLAAVARGEDPSSLDAVPFFESAEMRAELPWIQERYEWPTGQKLSAMQVEMTPRVRRLVDECAAYLSLVLAPEVVPQDLEGRLVPLHSEKYDRVRLRRFRHGDWIVDACISSNSVSVAARSAGAERVSGADGLKAFVLRAAQDLFVGKNSFLDEVTCGSVLETPYGLRGNMRPRVRARDEGPETVVGGRSLDGWPNNTMVFYTDGVTIFFATPKPPTRANIGTLPAPLERIRSDWFVGTEAEQAAEARRATE